jgi:hypothetical protein
MTASPRVLPGRGVGAGVGRAPPPNPVRQKAMGLARRPGLHSGRVLAETSALASAAKPSRPCERGEAFPPLRVQRSQPAFASAAKPAHSCERSEPSRRVPPPPACLAAPALTGRTDAIDATGGAMND